ncbi:MAG: DinB family protein [Bacteroidota bacterium]
MSLQEFQLLQLKSQLEGVRFLLSVTTTNQQDLMKRPPTGKWSPHEQICHLARVQDIFFARFEKIINERISPKLERYSAESDPEWNAIKQKSTQASLEYAFMRRKELIDYLSGIKPGDVRKKGIHPALGELTLETWIEFFLAHEGFHIYRLISLLQYR